MGSNGGFIPNTFMAGSQQPAHRRRNFRNSLPNIDMLLSLPETDAVTNFQMPVRRMSLTEKSGDDVNPVGCRRNSFHKSLSMNQNNQQKIIGMRRTMSVDDCTDVAVSMEKRAPPIEHHNRKTPSTDDCTDVAVSMEKREPLEHRRSSSLKESEDLLQSLQTFDSQYHELSPPPFPRSIGIKKELSPNAKSGKKSLSFSPDVDKAEGRKSVETKSTCESSAGGPRQFRRSIMQGHRASVASRRALFRDRPATMRFSSVWDLDREELTDDDRPRCCGKSRSDVVLWSFLLLIAFGVGGYMAYLYVPRTPKHSESNGAVDISESSTVIASNKNSSTVQTVAAKMNATDASEVKPPPFDDVEHIEAPPLDLEAMCSASNLPGSLPACLSACLPAACCYPDYTGPSCSKTPECSLFEPHCDIFFDAWPQSTEGVLRDVTKEMMDMCVGPKTINSTDEPALKANSSVATTHSIVVRNRLRGHVGQSNVRSQGNSTSAKPLVEGTCNDYCTAAKCCNAAVVNDPKLSGFNLSPLGVYNDASSGEYVMTNCQVSNAKNRQLCSKYKQLCATDLVPIATPVSGESTITAATSLEASESSILTWASADNTTATQTAEIEVTDRTAVTTPASGESTFITPTSLAASETTVLTLVSADDTTATQTAELEPVFEEPIASNFTLSETFPKQSSSNPTVAPSNASETNLRPPSSPHESSVDQAGVFETPSSPPKASKIPTSSPISNLPPLTLADIKNIHDSCGTEKAKFLIQTGDESAKDKCIEACLSGICCLADGLWYAGESCFEGNQHICSRYAACIILKNISLQSDEKSDTNEIIEVAGNSTI